MGKLYVMWVGIAVVVMVVVTRPELRGAIEGTDWRNYFTAVVMVKNGTGGELYDLGKQKEWQRSFVEKRGPENLLPYFNWPPPAVMLTPLAYLDYAAAYGVWMIINLVLLAWLAQKSGWGWKIALFAPAWTAVVHGQMTLMASAALYMAWKNWREGQNSRAGWWLALGTGWRWNLFLAPVAVLALEGKWRGVRAWGLGMAGWMGISIAAVGPRGMADYWRLLRGTGVEGLRSAEYGGFFGGDSTWYSLLGKLGWEGGWLWLGWGLAVAAVVGLSWFVWRGGKSFFNWRWSGGLLAGIMMSIHTGYHDLSVLALGGGGYPTNQAMLVVLALATSFLVSRPYWAVILEMAALVWMAREARRKAKS